MYGTAERSMDVRDTNASSIGTKRGKNHSEGDVLLRGKRNTEVKTKTRERDDRHRGKLRIINKNTLGKKRESWLCGV